VVWRWPASIAAFNGVDFSKVRPRSMQNVPGLDPNASPFERFLRLARMIARVPKAEADEAEKGKEQRNTSRCFRGKDRGDR